MDIQKYQKNPRFSLNTRTWPEREIKKPPRWCSVDLRDGNQSLEIPMSIEKKMEMYQLLLKMGFKEIEVGFPGASEIEYMFVRKLIEEDLIPEDVTIQVLTQARENQIKETFKAISGAKKAIIHLYNSTSKLQRDVVFKKGKKDIIEIARNATKYIKEQTLKYKDTKIILEYSPESFTETEIEYALDICEEVIKIWEPSSNNNIILNLPATVEKTTPNIYADQIEWFNNNISNRENVTISIHTHNDRGTGVAASELGILAGADRIEGTLFGNGERTGNADLVILGMNLFSQGIDPKLKFEDIDEIIRVYEKCTQMNVPDRAPYAGKLVYTAFSGSHQDAIKKGLKDYKVKNKKFWKVPYLPLDPKDLGREYKEIIRINSQSGKGGIAYILETKFGLIIPRKMQINFRREIQKMADISKTEIKPEEVLKIFKEQYLKENGRFKLDSYETREKNSSSEEQKSTLEVIIWDSDQNKKEKIIEEGNGPINALYKGVTKSYNLNLEFVSYNEHSLKIGSDANAVSYINLQSGKNNFFGAGIDENITVASFKAILNAINNYLKFKKRGK